MRRIEKEEWIDSLYLAGRGVDLQRGGGGGGGGEEGRKRGGRNNNITMIIIIIINYTIT